MVKININIEKKDLWLISAVFVFLVGAGVVVAYNSGATPNVMGHSAEELEVDIPGQGITNLQNAINNNWLGSGEGIVFGDWEDLSNQIVNEEISGIADNDGIIVASSSSNGGIEGYTDGVLRLKTRVTDHGYNHAITMPVKKGSSWKVVFLSSDSESVYWMPIISSGGGSGEISDIKVALIECGGDCSNEGTANEICSLRFGSGWNALNVDCEDVNGVIDENRNMDLAIDWCGDTNGNDMTITCYN